MLRDAAAPGDAEHVDAVVAEVGQQPAISRHSPVKRYGRGGSGEPPMPGGSNLITSTAGSSAATKGSSSSRRAPMPLISSNGYRGGRPDSSAPA